MKLAYRMCTYRQHNTTQHTQTQQTHTQTHTIHTCTNTNTHICTNIYINIHIHIHTLTHIHTHIYTHTHNLLVIYRWLLGCGKTVLIHLTESYFLALKPNTSTLRWRTLNNHVSYTPTSSHCSIFISLCFCTVHLTVFPLHMRKLFIT